MYVYITFSGGKGSHLFKLIWHGCLYGCHVCACHGAG